MIGGCGAGCPLESVGCPLALTNSVIFIRLPAGRGSRALSSASVGLRCCGCRMPCPVGASVGRASRANAANTNTAPTAFASLLASWAETSSAGWDVGGAAASLAQPSLSAAVSSPSSSR
eukprot:354450-Chlamydomonas_euryale.AAC.2